MMKATIAAFLLFCCCCVIALTAFGWWTPPTRPTVAVQQPPKIDIVKVRNEARMVARRNEVRRESARHLAEAAVLADMSETLQLFRRTRSWTLVLKLAGIYEHGSYPLFRENPRMAQALYMAAASSSTDRDIAEYARTKVLDVIAPTDSAGKPLPTNFGEAMVRDAATAVVRAPEPLQQSQPLPQPVPRPRPALIDSSAQNVHDHGVVASLKKRILQNDTNTRGDDVSEDVLDAILNLPKIRDEIKSDAVNFIVEGVDAAVNESMGISARDALASTWRRINDIGDSDVRSNAVETLAMQCADGYNHGHMVCSTGRIARIVGALDGIDEKKILPTWVIKEEIASKAAAYARDGLDAKAFRDEMTRTYVADLGMSAEVIGPLVETYAEHIV